MSQSAEDAVCETTVETVAPPQGGDWTVWLAALTDEQREKLRHAIQYDDSGLFNSRHFHELLRIEMDRSRRYKRMLSLAVVRLDCLTAIRAERGAAEAEQFLRHAATVLKKQIRSVDVGGRMTELELAVIMPETTGPAAAMVASRICNNILASAPMPVASQQEDTAAQVVSVGVAAFPRDARDWSDLVFWARTDLEPHPF